MFWEGWYALTKKDNKTIQQPHCGYNVALHCIELAHCITILGQFNGMVRYRHECKLVKQFWQHFLRKTFHILRKCINSTQTSFWLTINNEKNIFRHLQCLYSCVAIVETALPLDSFLDLQKKLFLPNLSAGSGFCYGLFATGFSVCSSNLTDTIRLVVNLRSLCNERHSEL